MCSYPIVVFLSFIDRMMVKGDEIIYYERISIHLSKLIMLQEEFMHV
jgi:hypothetical protein